MSHPVIFDPTNGTSRPAHTFHQVDEADGYKVLEGATGDLFAFDQFTFRSTPIRDLPHLNAHPLMVEGGESSFVSLATTLVEGEELTEGTDDPHILRAIFVVGAGGSGKGRVTAAMFEGTGLKIINQDTHLERFMQAAKVPLADVGLRYDLLKKAQRLKNSEVRQYGSRRLGIVVDSTGWDYKRVAEPAKKLRNLGYDISLVFVSTSLKTALARNKARGDAGGRVVPDSFIQTAHEGAHDNLPAFEKLFGPRNVFLIDNDAEVSDKKWSASVVPKLRKIAAKILKAPLRNTRGKAWLIKQADPATASDPTPAKDWPADAPPPALPLPAAPVFKAPAKVVTKAANVPKGSPKVLGGWNNATKRFEGVDIVSLPPAIICEWIDSGSALALREWLDKTHPELEGAATT